MAEHEEAEAHEHSHEQEHEASKTDTTKHASRDSIEEIEDNHTKADEAEHSHHHARRRGPFAVMKRVFKRPKFQRPSKRVFIAAGVVALAIAGVFILPSSRYKVLGLFIQKSLGVQVVDTKTGRVISGAEVQVAGKKALTDKNGKAIIPDVPLGEQQVKIIKKYYKDTDQKLTVRLIKDSQSFSFSMEATGRQVPILVKNKISGKGIEGIQAKLGESEALTDKDGKTVLVVPPIGDTQEIVLSGSGYLESKVVLQVVEQEKPENTFAVVPAGKIYFLSKQSGKIDVVKTNLDGSSREVVLAGTGKESETDTILLASRDWKYLGLKSIREGDKPKVYVIDTTQGDKLLVADEGDADFTLRGWSGHYLVFNVSRNNAEGEVGRYRLKSYHPEDDKLTLLDASDIQKRKPYEWSGEQWLEEEIGNVSLVDDRIYYTKLFRSVSYYWYDIGAFGGVQHSAISLLPDGSDKKVLGKIGIDTLSTDTYGQIYLFKPHEFYISGYDYNQGKQRYFEYEIGDKLPKEITDQSEIDKFNQPYPTYLLSPSGNETFWSEERDGKTWLFIGDNEGNETARVGKFEETSTYGWYGDQYLLATKKGSELYILSRDGGELLNIADYHKPTFDYRGYGGGYGGL